MPVTFRQYINSVNAGAAAPIPSETPSATPYPSSSLPAPSVPVSVTPSVTPPISPSVTPSPTVSSTNYYCYRVIEGTCNPLVGTCEGVGVNNFVWSPNGSLTLGLWYTGSVNTVYQPYEEVILSELPNPVYLVDNNPYNSCNEACKLPVCYVSSSVVVTQTGWLSYTTCEGSTVYVELCVGSHSIDDCIKCETIAGNSGPGGSGSGAQFTYTCGYACYPPPPPSVSSTPSISVTPSVTLSPSVTRTPSVTPTITLTPSVTNTPSVTPTPPISPSCECDPGYTSSFDGSTCYSSLCVPATSGSTIQTPAWANVDNAWGYYGVRIYPAGGYNVYGTLTAANYDYVGVRDTVPTSSVNKFWARRLNSVGMWDGNNQYWPGTSANQIGNPPYPGFLSMCATINVPSTKTYYIGLAGDNDINVTINGTTIINQPDNLPVENFRWWHIYPVTLTAGPNIVEAGNWNRNQIGAFAVEIYDNTLAQLTASKDESDLNIVFSTGDYLAARTVIYPDGVWNYQTNRYEYVSKSYADGPYLNRAFCTNYSCPEGFELNIINPSNPICCKNILVPNCSVPPSPSVTPTVTPTATVVPSVSPTPSISDTPCPTVSVTATPSISVTPTPTFGCSCFAGEIIDNNLYSYFDCNNNLLTGSDAQGTVICLNVNLPKTRNIGNIGFSGNDVCGNCYDEV